MTHQAKRSQKIDTVDGRYGVVNNSGRVVCGVLVRGSPRCVVGNPGEGDVLCCLYWKYCVSYDGV